MTLSAERWKANQTPVSFLAAHLSPSLSRPAAKAAGYIHIGDAARKKGSSVMKSNEPYDRVYYNPMTYGMYTGLASAGAGVGYGLLTSMMAPRSIKIKNAARFGAIGLATGLAGGALGAMIKNHMDN